MRQALKYFSRQTYRPKELIVVDDPGLPAFHLVNGIPGVRYFQTGEHLPIGSKLNFGIRESRGEIIQKLDDDDYYHPEFLAATAGALRRRNLPDAVAACASCLVLIVASGEVKLWTGVFAGGTFCFPKRLWQKTPFRDIAVAEDQAFLKDHQPERIEIHNPELYIYVRHGDGHLWSRFLKSDGLVRTGDDVTKYLEGQPNYSRSLKDCVGQDDFRFYQGLTQPFGTVS